MTDLAIDLITLDRRIAQGHGRIEKELASLRQRALASDGAEDPDSAAQGEEALRAFSQQFGGIRDLAGQATFKALEQFPGAGAAFAAHRDGLLRWAHEMLQLRVAWDLLVDEAEAMRAVDPRMKRAAPQAKNAPARTYAEALHGLVEAPHVAAADVALTRLEELAAPVAAVRKELRARRFEVASRLGLAHPWQLAADGGASMLAELARGVLAATEPLAVELHKAARRSPGAAPAPASVGRTIVDAFARDATEGWPAHLGKRWLDEVFRALAPRLPRVSRLPRPLGGSSFVRAASAWGASLRLAGTARSLPFALARDPYATEAHVVGGAISTALASGVFARRKLGLTARLADAHARSLGRVLFVELRMAAASLLAGMKSSPDEDEIEELSTRVFGAPLPGALGAAWSYGAFAGGLPVELPARLLGATRSHGLATALVDRYDEDWFDNPRAGAHLASIGAGPAWQGEVPAGAAIAAIARVFEGTLG